MTAKKRYRTTEDGNGLVDTKKGVTIAVESFAVAQSGRHPVVKITDRAGKHYTIARYTIDESAYSYGEVKGEDTGDVKAPAEFSKQKRAMVKRAATVSKAVTPSSKPFPKLDIDLLRAQCYARVDEVIDKLRALWS